MGLKKVQYLNFKILSVERPRSIDGPKMIRRIIMIAYILIQRRCRTDEKNNSKSGLTEVVDGTLFLDDALVESSIEAASTEQTFLILVPFSLGKYFL